MLYLPPSPRHTVLYQRRHRDRGLNILSLLSILSFLIYSYYFKLYFLSSFFIWSEFSQSIYLIYLPHLATPCYTNVVTGIEGTLSRVSPLLFKPPAFSIFSWAIHILYVNLWFFYFFRMCERSIIVVIFQSIKRGLKEIKIPNAL